MSIGVELLGRLKSLPPSFSAEGLRWPYVIFVNKIRLAVYVMTAPITMWVVHEHEMSRCDPRTRRNDPECIRGKRGRPEQWRYDCSDDVRLVSCRSPRSTALSQSDGAEFHGHRHHTWHDRQGLTGLAADFPSDDAKRRLDESRTRRRCHLYHELEIEGLGFKLRRTEEFHQ